jgi:octaprenyl-diphosphate synthase
MPNQQTTITRLQKPMAASLQALEECIQSQAEACEPCVKSLVAASLAHSGKRLRSLLVFYAGFQNKEVNPDLVKIATILELVHLATLVHDDIIDGALMRHHAPTLHAEHGPNAAVLLGDVLFSHALVLASEFSTPKVCRLVARGTRRVCSGELMQSFDRVNQLMTLEDYFRAIDLKTAELFAVASELGGLFGYGNLQWSGAASCFGRALGNAYQILDDWWDLTADASVIGKTLGTDLSSGKLTLPLILLQEQYSDWRRMTPEALLEALRSPEIAESTRAYFDESLRNARESIAPYAHLAAYEGMSAMVDGMGHLWKE